MKPLCVRLARVAALTVLATVVSAGSLWSQEPPDSVVIADSLAVQGSLSPDALTVADSLAETDSLSADTIYYNLPRPRGGEVASFATGVWEWDRHDIMADGANTLAELFQRLPGVIALLGGDYGTPASVSAFGRGGGGYRILRDGLEVYAAEGSVPNLQLVGLAGVARVRLDRSMGQMLIEMWSHEYDDGRPFSVVEAGTGDLDTNLFRGIYADPTALGGSVAVGLERMDTRGRERDGTEGGNRTGSWARYQFHAGNRFGLALDYRSLSSRTKVSEFTPTAERSDVSLRAAFEALDGVTLSAFAGRTRYGVDAPADSSLFVGGSRSQLGGTLGVDRGPLWLHSSYRSFEGGLPSRRFDARGGLSFERWGGVSGQWSSTSWNDRNASNFGARVWLSPFSFSTLFASYETGTYGSRTEVLSEGGGTPPLSPDRPFLQGPEGVVDRTGARAGLTLARWGVTLGGAALYSHADQVLPLGLELDDQSLGVVGVHRNGYEGTAVLPTFMEGLTLEGSYQYWDEDGPYQPAQIYRGSFEFHRVFLESGNLELWGSLGVRGHDPMTVFVADDMSEAGGLAQIPFYQSWYWQAQVRVVTVRLWFGMDNFTFRRNLQTYPDRLLPFGRTFFALRWDLWN